MMGHLRRWWMASVQAYGARQFERKAIPEPLWQFTLARHAFLMCLPLADQVRLRKMVSAFLDSKEFSGGQGLVVTDEMAVAIAAQACLPILNIGLPAYRHFVGIVVHPDEVTARRRFEDEHGLVHEWTEVLSGEAMEGGPVMLSWHDVTLGATDRADANYNVVIHEFAHVLDMLDGVADGVPPLADHAARRLWRNILLQHLDELQLALAHGEETCLDPYAATGPEELFAVATEAFFVAAVGMKKAHPQLYELLMGFYRQDPAALATPAA
jgi:MtfA peptidase